MRKTITTNTEYERLLTDIKQELNSGLIRAQLAYEQEKIITYWKVGKNISLHLFNNKSRADYGKQLYKQLSQDLSLGERLLYQMSQFYNAYPNFEPSKNLKWSHYRLLTSVKDPKQRQELEKQVSSSNWTKRTLESFIKSEGINKGAVKKAIAPSSPKALPVYGAKLYSYKVFKESYSPSLLLDLGFKIYKETDYESFNSEYVQTVKTEDSYKITKATIKRKQLYTYKAFVTKIVDGDTIWLNIDCGFKTWTKQKVRLRGIDTPSLETEQGQKAWEYIKKELKDIPFVVIQSHGRDKYGRYLCDLFYSHAINDPQTVIDKGAFLNQSLLNKSFAINI